MVGTIPHFIIGAIQSPYAKKVKRYKLTRRVNADNTLLFSIL